MYWIAGGDGRNHGPVSLDLLRHWVREGRATAQSMARLEPATEWKPLGTFPEVSDLFDPAIPAILGATAAPPQPADPEALWQELLARGQRPAIGRCIRRSWNLLKRDFGLLVAASLLAWLLMGAGGATPIAGVIVAIVIDGPLMGGLYALFLRRIRGQEASVSTIFSGFERACGQLILGYVVTTTLAILAVAPAALPPLVWYVTTGQPANMPPALLAGTGVLVVAALSLMTYLSVAWVLTTPLIVDQGLQFWQAMQLSRRVIHRHWWSWFGLLLVAGLISASGLVLCCVGVLFTAPFGLAALMYAYADLLGPIASRSVKPEPGPA